MGAAGASRFFSGADSGVSGQTPPKLPPVSVRSEPCQKAYLLFDVYVLGLPDEDWIYDAPQT